MLHHEGHYSEVAAARCPFCRGPAEVTQLVNDEVDRVVSEFIACPQCGTYPLYMSGSGYVAERSGVPSLYGFPIGRV